MAVPKKKNSNIKNKYSIIKKEYLNKMKNGVLICKHCSRFINLDIENFKYFWKKKILF